MPQPLKTYSGRVTPKLLNFRNDLALAFRSEQHAVSSVQTFILPIGILMGVFHFDVDFPVGRSPDLIAHFLCTGAVLSYALTRWIRGVALTLCIQVDGATGRAGCVPASEPEACPSVFLVLRHLSCDALAVLGEESNKARIAR